MLRTITMIATLAIFTLTLAAPAFAGKKYNSSSGYTQDTYGRWERNDNAYRDSDGDGVVNHYDSNNRNSSIW